MSKEAFLAALRERLSGFPRDDIEERILFYEEMIDERIEDGMPEEEAVAAVGSPDEISRQIMSEIPLSKLVMNKVKPKRGLRAWEIILLVLGFPLWFPLLIAFFAILLSLYIVVWSGVICVYAVNFSFAAGAVASIPCAAQYFLSNNWAGALFMIGAGIALAGITLLTFVLSAAFTKGMLKLTGRFFGRVKSLFAGKEGADHAYA